MIKEGDNSTFHRETYNFKIENSTSFFFMEQFKAKNANLLLQN